MSATAVFTSGVAFLRKLIAGGGTAGYVPSGPLYTLITPASNVSTDETTLGTYTLPAGSLSTNGQGVRITAVFTAAANGNTKTPRIYFGDTELVLYSAAANGTSWVLIGHVFRTGASTQVGSGLAFLQSSSGRAVKTAPTETLSGAVVIKATGQSGTTSDDITLVAMTIEFLPVGSTVV